MRLLVDLIACQTPSRNRGIGRYTFELTRAMASLRGDNEMICMADPLLPEGFEELRQEFIRRLPAGGFLPYFHEPIPLDDPLKEKEYTQLATTLIQQAHQVVSPDLVLIPSLFEGWGIPQVVVPCPQKKKINYKQVVILYDLIPYILRKHYLDHNPTFSNWYMQRFNSLKNFDLVLAISEATRQDAIRLLNFPPERVVNISSAASGYFQKLEFTQIEKFEFLQRMGISRPFIFYLGGNDFRKNMEGALRVFANLPHELIEHHQLVLNDVGDETIFRSKIRKLGLSDQDVVIIGRVSDDEMLLLYNLCTVFFFPSLYEGFGLPVLEAMACGAPVLASNNSSLPEVVGWKDMLFDIKNTEQAVSSLAHVLTDTGFREELSQYGLERAKRFSWQESAQRAWQAMESLQQESLQMRVVSTAKPKVKRSRIAFVSPLPPQQSGISEYSAELLPYLSKYFHIDLFAEPGLNLSADVRLQTFPAYPWTELLKRRDDYATVVYQFGNSAFHSHMFELIHNFPGMVVLHDFYLSHLVRQTHTLEENFCQELDYSHGIKCLIDYQTKGNNVVWDWPTNWRLLRQAKEVVVHSAFQKRLLDQFYCPGWQPHLNLIPPMRTVEPEINPSLRELARGQLGIPEDCLLFCAFGQIGPTKLNDLTTEAFLLAQQSLNQDCQLVFVGDCPDKTYWNHIMSLLQELGLSNRVHMTGFVDREEYRSYLLAANVAIQLRQKSRGETSRAVLDCMSYGLPVILNTHGTLNDYRDEDVVKIVDPIILGDLSQAMVHLGEDEAYRLEKGKQARKTTVTQHNPDVAAAAYAEVIERTIEFDDRIILKPAIDALEAMKFPAELVQSQARYAAENHSLRNRSRILLDVSQIVRMDARSGIQRVVKRLVAELLLMTEPSRFIEPIYFLDGEWRRANRLVETLIELPLGKLGPEKLIFICPGDILVLLDSSWTLYDQFTPIFEKVRKLGGKIVTVVYDLLPVNFPHFFDENMPKIFSKWLDSACVESDMLVCISHTVAQEVARYRMQRKIGMDRKLDINHFHLGADIPVVSSEADIRQEVTTLAKGLSYPLFLTVGTLEPRKGHAFTLDAFDEMWKQGDKSLLVFAGKVGWNVAGLEASIRNHPMLNKQLFFIENPSDAELETLYSKATALIAASSGEGFGLPIVEAARHNVPTLASDIPVFHEVGGEGAIYFSLDSPSNLAKAVKSMIKLTPEEQLTMAQKVKVLSWKESARMLLNVLQDNQVYKT